MPDLKINIKGFTGHLDKSLKRAGAGLKNFGNKVKSSFRAGAGLITGFIAVVLAAGVAITKIGADFEQTSVAFGTMLKSGDKAAAMLERLTEFSTKTPFKPDEIYKAAKTLLAFGASAEEVHGIIATIGDVSSATGKDLNELAIIYGKVFVKGKIQAEELNQMSEAGIPIIRELQKQYNATAAEIFKMGSQGTLSFNDMNNALTSMTSEGGLFFNAMAAQSETFNGKMSTLWGNIQEVGRALSDLEFPKELLDAANEVAKTLASELGDDADPTKPMTTMDKFGALFAEEQALGTGKAYEGKDVASIAKQGRLDMIAAAKKEEAKKASQADSEAAARKAEAAARAGDMGKAGALLGGASLGGGGTLASLGGDISGGGIQARLKTEERQIAILQEIRDATVNSSTASKGMKEDAVVRYWQAEINTLFKD